MLKKIVMVVLGLAGVGIVAVLAMASGKPDEFTIERKKVIKASPELLVQKVADFKGWPAWSPFESDKSMKRTFKGPDNAVGSVYEWDSKGDAGQGSMTLTELLPGKKVAMRLDFVKPMEATNDVEFNVRPVDGGSEVAWVMHGKSPFMCKVMQVFIDQDKMCGSMFETGLNNLKLASEGKADNG